MITGAPPIPTKKLRNGFALPVYGLGTWGLGGYFAADGAEDAAAIRTIRTALDAGIRHIDTAEMYGAGHAEELVGAALRGYDRSAVWLASKALGHHLDAAGLPAALAGSLRRLNTDYLDLYMIHHPNDAIPLAETMRALDALREQGRIRAIGVSNFALPRLIEAQRHTRYPIVVNQVHYSLAVREPERTGLPAYCQAHDILLVAWKPLPPLDPPAPLLAELAARYDKSPAQIALNWLIAQDNVVVISRTRDAAHLRENLGVVGWALSGADVERLRHDFPGQQARSDTYALR